MKLVRFPITIILLSSGCLSTNPFSRFYYDQLGGADITQFQHLELAAQPDLFTGADVNTDTERMLENGYVLIGYSSFNAGPTNERYAKSQAKKVHASAVVLYSQYTNTVSGAVPLTLPDNQTSTTYNSGNVYGSGSGYGAGGSTYYSGTGNYSGSSTTTTYGTKTTYIPYNVRRHDYYATYWAKAKGTIFGAHVRDLTSDERKQTGSNKGVAISIVVKRSSAYNSDFFKGDILKSFNGVEIIDAAEFYRILPEYANSNVKIAYVRDGEFLEKAVQFQPNLNAIVEQADY